MNPKLDLVASEWAIPAAKMKQRRAHIVPLALQSVAIYRRDGQHQEIRQFQRFIFKVARKHL